MKNDFCSGRRQRGGIIINLAMKNCISGKLLIYPEFPEDVQRKYSVWDHPTPKMQREVPIDASQPHYEIIFKDGYGPFSSIPSMDMRRDQLIFIIYLNYVLFYDVSKFIVQNLHPRLWSPLC